MKQGGTAEFEFSSLTVEILSGTSLCISIMIYKEAHNDISSES